VPAFSTEFVFDENETDEAIHENETNEAIHTSWDIYFFSRSGSAVHGLVKFAMIRYRLDETVMHMYHLYVPFQNHTYNTYVRNRGKGK
jgi:hypothetical protein